MNATPKRRPRAKAKSSKFRVPPQDTVKALTELIKLMPHIALEPDGHIDFEDSDAQLLVRIARHADTAVGVINLGVGAIGNLLVYASPEIEDGSVSADTVEALGWLLAELGDLGACLFTLSAHCRRETADFVQAEQSSHDGAGSGDAFRW